MKILRAADRVAVPWKNGQGLTREIAAHPPGAGLDDFDWRISMAVVDAGGPFSHFAGIDRVLTMLEGRLALRVDGAPAVTLDPHAAPFAFRGDAAVDAELLSGPATDLNVMTRRGRITAAVERLDLTEPIQITARHTTVVIALDETLTLSVGDRRRRLDRHDAALLERAPRTQIGLEAREPATLVVAHIETTAGAAA